MSKIDDAYQLYADHIYDPRKIFLLTKHNLKIAGSVPSVLWELFGSILTGRTGAGTVGADLNGWEVKSSIEGGAYEYQYHLKTGAKKLGEDCLVNHLFCSYSETYKNVSVFAIKGSQLGEYFFQQWMPQYEINYSISVPANQRRQRFRKSITSSYVEKNGSKILRIENGKLISRCDNILDEFNSY